MKVSEFIQELQAVILDKGDIQVYVDCPGNFDRPRIYIDDEIEDDGSEAALIR